MSLTDDELRRLYRARPDEFVRVRNELARELKKDGRADDAAAVATRRRPSAIAWSLNQVARESVALVDAWSDAAEHLRDAMRRAVKGDAEAVRQAQAAERRASDALVAAARAQLSEIGARDSDAAATRIAGTLRAAMLDDDLAPRVRAGTLETDVIASGFGFGDVTADDIVPANKPGQRKAPVIADTRRAKAEAAAGAARRAAAAKARRAEATRLAAAADRLATAAERAQRRVEELRVQSERLHERMRDAEREARRARNEADRASAIAARARTANDD
jgi:hypothetical protein